MEEATKDLLSTFLKYDYAEAKELCKQFLTTVVAVLVISLTFAEKIIGVGVNKSSGTLYTPKLFLLGVWTSFVLSIITCGIGLAYITVAAGRVVYRERSDFECISNVTLVWIGFAGFSFIVGLISLLIAAGVAVWGSSGTG